MRTRAPMATARALAREARTPPERNTPSLVRTRAWGVRGDGLRKARCVGAARPASVGEGRWGQCCSAPQRGSGETWGALRLWAAPPSGRTHCHRTTTPTRDTRAGSRDASGYGGGVAPAPGGEGAFVTITKRVGPESANGHVAWRMWAAQIHHPHAWSLRAPC